MTNFHYTINDIQTEVKEKVVELGEGFAFLRRLTHAVDMAAAGLDDEADRGALQELCTAMSDRLNELDGPLAASTSYFPEQRRGKRHRQSRGAGSPPPRAIRARLRSYLLRWRRMANSGVAALFVAQAALALRRCCYQHKAPTPMAIGNRRSGCARH